MPMTDEEYWKLGTDQLELAHKRVMQLVETLPAERRLRVKKMLDGFVGGQYFTAPASTRRAFHNAFPAGLVCHSLNVYDNLVKLVDAFEPDRWPQHKLAFCALFHDLGKVGDGVEAFYVKTTEQWKQRKSEFYDVNPKCCKGPNAERGLYILQLYGITVDWEEYTSIRLNDGMGPAENKPYSFCEPDLSLLVHHADHLASRSEKKLGLE